MSPDLLTAALLFSRGDHKHDSSSSNSSSSNSNSYHHGLNHTCPVPDEQGPPIVPLVGTMTFHTIGLIVAGALMGLACILSFSLMLAHATHFSMPGEQKQIIRITFTIPVFAILSFLAILLESRAVYLIPLTNVYEAFALGGFFFLLCAWIHPDGAERERILDREGKLGMYNRVWFFVFQQPFVMTVLVVVQEITQAMGVFCATSTKVQFAHVWVSSLSSLTTTFAIGAVLRFHGATKQMTAQQKPLLKLVSFKGIVFLSWIQSALFSFLASSGHLHANNHLTFLDLSVGIPAMITCFEMMLFSILFLFAYPIGPYILKGHIAHLRHESGIASNPGYLGGPLGLVALYQAINILDLIKAIMVAPMRLVRGRATLKEERADKGPGTKAYGA